MHALNTSLSPTHPTSSPAPDTTWAAGLAALQAIEGRERPSILDALADIAPDLATLTIQFAYGQIQTRPGLDARQRQLVTVAALTALGHARPQLKFHLAGALTLGWSGQALVELMLQGVVYAGFPAGLNGIFALREVLTERGIPLPAPDAATGTTTDGRTTEAERQARGWQALQRIDGHAGTAVIEALADIAPDLAGFVIGFAFGEIYTRPGLDLVERELATVAMLGALGTAAPQLRVHVHGLLNVGGTRESLVEALMQLAVYAGFPAAINALLLAREVLAERAQEAAAPPRTHPQGLAG